MMQPDYSTIDLTVLRKLPTYTLPASYRLQEGMGNACFLDAPGYPTYFTRNVYTRFGNNPAKGPQMVITVPGEGLRVVEHSSDFNGSWDAGQCKVAARLHRLWKPLPLEHPRVQAWVDYCKGYFRNCYWDPRQPDKTHIGDWTMFDIIELSKVLNLECDYDMLLGIADAIMAQRGLDEIQKRAWNEVVHEVYSLTDSATRNIRKFYPGYEYEPDRTARWGDTGGDWWERLAEKPTPEECPGEIFGWGNKSDARHPVGSSRCQVCGWKAE